MGGNRLEITFACSDNDRTRAIIDGRVRIESCDVTCLVLEPAEMFARACRYAEFDITARGCRLARTKPCSNPRRSVSRN